MNPKADYSSTTELQANIASKADPHNWTGPEPGEETYSSNQMIEAYKIGVDEGKLRAAEEFLDNLVEKIRELAEHNAAKAGAQTRELLEVIQEMGFHPVRAILNERAFNDMLVLIILPEEEYIGERFLGMYSQAIEFEQKWKSEHYDIEFAFTADSESMDYNLLRIDGFTRFHTYLEPNES